MAHVAGVCPSGKHHAFNANSSSFQKIFAKANLFWKGKRLSSLAVYTSKQGSRKDFAKAKDLWEEEQQAQRVMRETKCAAD